MKLKSMAAPRQARSERRLPRRWPYPAAAFLLAAFLLAAAVVSGRPWGAPQSTLAAAPTPTSPAALEVMGQLGGTAWALAAQGNHLYLGQGAGLSVLDRSDPAAPRLVGVLPTPGIVKRVQVAGGYAFLAVEDAQYTRVLKVASLADPGRPQEVGSYVLGYDYGLGYAGLEMAVAGDHVYVADRDGLRLISVADKANPRQVAWYDLRGTPYSIAASGRYAYALVLQYEGQYLLEVVDVTEPTIPREVGSVAFTTGGLVGYLVAVGDYVYLGMGGAFQVFDVADKTSPRLAASYSPGCPGSYCSSSLAVAGEYAYLSQDYLVAGGSQSTLLVVSLADKTSPQVVGSLPMSDSGPVAVAGEYAYVAGWRYGNLHAVSVADKAKPQQVGVYRAPGPVGQITVAGDYAYAASYGNLYIISVADRARPQVVSSVAVSGQITSLFVAGDYAYTLATPTTVAEGDDPSFASLRILSVADKARPVPVGSYRGEPGERLVGGVLFVVGDYAYAVGSGGLWVISVADKASPRRVGFYALAYYYYTSGLYIMGDYAYVARGEEGGSGLRIISVADKANPQSTGFIEMRAFDVAVAGDYAYVAAGSRGLRVISVVDKAKPREVGSYDTPGEGRGISLAGDVAYMDDGRGGLRAISVADPTQPRELASYPSLYGASGAQMAVQAAGEYAYVANGEAGLLLFRLRYGAAPAPIPARPAPRVPAELVGHIGGQFKAVASDGWYVYGGEGPSLSILDFGDPARPRRVGSVAVPQVVEAVAVARGYVFVAAGWAGLRVISVADKANPREVGAYTPALRAGSALDVAVSGRYAYVAFGASGLGVVDVFDLTHPVEVGWYETYHPVNVTEVKKVIAAGAYLYLAPTGDILSLADPARPVRLGALGGGSQHVAVAGDYAYTLSGPIVYSIADKANPQVVGGASSCGVRGSVGEVFSGGVAVAGSYLYLLCWDQAKNSYGVRVFSIANPASPAEVGAVGLPDLPFGLAVARGYVYVASYTRGLRAVSVADPAQPAEVGAYDPLGQAGAVTVQGDYAYLADESQGLRIISVADKARPVFVGTYATTPRHGEDDVAASGGYVYLSTSYPGGLRVISVADPARPTLSGTYTVPVQAGGLRLAAAGNYVYLAAGTAGLRIVSVADPARPLEMGAYVDPEVSVQDVAVSGNYAYVAYSSTKSGPQGGGLAVISLANPRAPAKVGSIFVPQWTRSVAVGGGKVYLSANDALRVITATQPATPTLAGLYPPVVFMAAAADHVYAIRDYCGTVGEGLSIISAADPARPRAAAVIPGACGDLAVAGGYAYSIRRGGLSIYRLHSLFLSPMFQRVEPGTTFTVTIESAAIADLGGFQFRLNYDPRLVRLESFTPFPLPAGNRTWTALGPLLGPDSVTYGAYSYGNGAGPSGGRTLAQAVFSALARGKATLSLDKVRVADTSGKEAVAEALGAQVQVGEPFRTYLPRVTKGFREH